MSFKELVNRVRFLFCSEVRWKETAAGSRFLPQHDRHRGPPRRASHSHLRAPCGRLAPLQASLEDVERSTLRPFPGLESVERPRPARSSRAIVDFESTIAPKSLFRRYIDLQSSPNVQPKSMKRLQLRPGDRSSAELALLQQHQVKLQVLQVFMKPFKFTSDHSLLLQGEFSALGVGRSLGDDARAC